MGMESGEKKARERWVGAGERGSKEELAGPGRGIGGTEHQERKWRLRLDQPEVGRPSGRLRREQVGPDPQATSLPPLHLIHPSFIEYLLYTWLQAMYCAVK